MQSFDVSPNEKSPELPVPRKRVSRLAISGRDTTDRPKAAMATQLGPASSPPMSTQSGLTPSQPRQRRSSVNLPVPGSDAPHGAVLSRPEPPEESDCEMDTPTKKPARRARVKPSGPRKQLGPSPLRRTASPGPSVAVGYEAAEDLRVPLFARSHTSPETQSEVVRKSRRPSATERSASDPATPSKKLSGAQLDSSMAKLIRNGPSTKTDRKDGGIYLLIGRAGPSQGDKCSVQAPEERLALHGHGREYPLANYRHRRRCACNTQHREYFEVSEDIAVEVFERWRDFCKKRPWDGGGTIKKVWARRLDTRGAFDGPGRDFDHGRFGRHWSGYTMPRLVELVLSDTRQQWERWFPDRWKAVAMAEMFTIAFLSPASVWMRAWMAAVGALLLVDMVVSADLQMVALVARLMEGGLQPLVLRYVYWRDGLAADAEDPAPEAGSGGTTPPPHQGAGEDAWSETAEGNAASASDETASVVGGPMDTDRDAGSQELTDEEDGPDGDVCSPASPETVSVRGGVFEQPSSTDPNVQKKMLGGREVTKELIDLTTIESD
ncbi:hypothetical protein LX36DRAFT_676960 [Colletotrichum falcatum]|nr:hypothetical protein LX36DRAFT_676960 [Colletotrichum falcatum]